MKTIVLTGMMGAGKTTIGQALGKQFNIPVIDIDKEVQAIGRRTISEMFKINGENYFRELEKETIFNRFSNENLIISLGGGAFENKETRDFLLENSNVIYLEASPENIFNRIKNDTSRPLLCDKMTVENISKILNSRKENYQSATYIINTDNKTTDEIIDEIMKELKND